MACRYAPAGRAVPGGGLEVPPGFRGPPCGPVVRCPLQRGGPSSRGVSGSREPLSAGLDPDAALGAGGVESARHRPVLHPPAPAANPVPLHGPLTRPGRGRGGPAPARGTRGSRGLGTSAARRLSSSASRPAPLTPTPLVSPPLRPPGPGPARLARWGGPETEPAPSSAPPAPRGARVLRRGPPRLTPRDAADRRTSGRAPGVRERTHFAPLGRATGNGRGAGVHPPSPPGSPRAPHPPPSPPLRAAASPPGPRRARFGAGPGLGARARPPYGAPAT